MEKKTNLDKEAKIKVATIIFISIFFSIFNLYLFILSAEDTELIVITSIILFFIYYIVISKLYIIYNRTLLFFTIKISKIKIKESNLKTYSVWLLPSLIAAITSFVIFAISNYYMSIFTSTLKWSEIDYIYLIKKINMIYPWVVLLFILLGLIIQTYFIIRMKVKTIPAFISSFLTIIVFTLIFFVIRNIISNIIGWL